MPDIRNFRDFPDFPGGTTTASLDDKNRISVPKDFLNVIKERNGFYLRYINSFDSAFSYRHPNLILLDRKYVGHFVRTEKQEEGNDRDLVEILMNPPITADLTETNNGLYTVIEEIKNKRFLIARPFFDWRLYLRDHRLYAEGDLSKLFEERPELVIEKKGSLVLSSFIKTLEISNEVGFKGFGGTVIIGNPDYLRGKFD